MNISIISFTENGRRLSLRTAEVWSEGKAFLYTKCSMAEKGEGLSLVKESIGEWAKKQMQKKNVLLFIGACGIAVRAIAPCITDKLHDSPVLVMDEKGAYVIPILSGHAGGANEIALRLSERLGAKAVITTATDINHRFAIDLFALRNGLRILNKEGIAKVSAKVLAGQRISMAVEEGHLEERENLPEEIRLVPYPPDEAVDVIVAATERSGEALLHLKPREYVVGIGCRRGKEAEKLGIFIENALHRAGIAEEEIYALASIDRKKDEKALLIWSRQRKVPFRIFSAEELLQAEGSFQVSDFVKKQVGVDNVCERAAVKGCGVSGTLIAGKYAEDGMTIAIAKREWRITFDEK